MNTSILIRLLVVGGATFCLLAGTACQRGPAEFEGVSSDAADRSSRDESAAAIATGDVPVAAATNGGSAVKPAALPSQEATGDPLWPGQGPREVPPHQVETPKTNAQPVLSSKEGAQHGQATPRSKSIAVTETAVGRSHQVAGEQILSADGRRFAYATQQRARWLVVVDGQEGPAYDAIGGLTISSDGKRVLYGAIQGKNPLSCSTGARTQPMT